MGLRAQALQIVDEAVPRILGVLVVPAHVDRLFGADFLAITAEHAAEFVDFVDQRIPVSLLVLTGHQLDAVRRTDLGAETARYTLRATLLVGEHAVRPAPPAGHRPVVAALLFRILHRDLGPEDVRRGEHHALGGRPQIGRARRRTLEDLYTDRHQAAFRSAVPETTRPRSRTQTRSTKTTRFTAPSDHAILGPHAQPSCMRKYQMAAARRVR